MIINSSKNYVETNMTGSTSFSIKASAKAFKILSDGLYSDKIRAVIRELSCNALDSHTGAGCPDKPIIVHLPNKLEPWFSVRDEGLGLSIDNVLKLYTTYFESTKTDSNDQIGALGLGSKSPFSYTDSFTIVSRYNGIESLYSAYIGVNGEPSIQHILDIETSEPNGVEIKFGVNDDDIKVFKEKAQIVFRAFKVHPDIIGNAEYIPLSRGTLILSGDGWSLYESTGYNNRTAFAVQGNIEYPIDTSNIRGITKDQMFVLRQNIYIDFPIGDLDIAASREQLGYDENTVNNIKRVADEVFSELVETLNKSISDCKSLWDASIVSKKLLNRIYDASNYITLTWKKKQIRTSFDLEDTPNIIKFSPFHTKIAVKKDTNVKYVNVDEKIEFVRLDGTYKNKVATNVRYYVKQTGKTIILFNNLEFLKLVGSPQYKNYSTDIPDAPKQISTTSYKPSHILGCNFKKFTGSYYYNDNEFRVSYSNLDHHITTTTKNVYYIKITGHSATDSKRYDKAVKFAKYTGLIDHDISIIVGIKHSMFDDAGKFMSKLDAHHLNFIEFPKFMDSYREEFRNKPIIKNIINNISERGKK